MSTNSLHHQDSSPGNKNDADTNSAYGIDVPPTSSGTTTALNIDDDQEKRPKYVTGIPMVLTVVGLLLTAFCVGLDRSIMSVVIPKITAEFHSLDDIAWYGSAFLLTTCCFQLIFGKFYSEFNIVYVFLVALAIFEIGSVVCAAAPSSVALIIGRAVAGVGCAGLTSGFFVIVANSMPLDKRPLFTAIVGGANGIAMMAAPTLGGVFTDRLTWRWCFWINLPLGAVTALTLFFFLKLPDEARRDNTSGFLDVLRKLDITGNLVLMPFLVCLLLALQWGGSEYAWSNWRVILCLTLFSVLFLIWVYIQYTKGEEATLSFRILKQRSIACGIFFCMILASCMFVISYYVAIWFQAVKDVTAEKSGINFLAVLGPIIFASILAGGAASRIGYYVPQMILSSVILSVANGLIYRFSVDTSTTYWAGTLATYGIGLGFGLQMPLTAAQTVLKGSDVPIGTSVMILFQALGGTVFLAVGQNIFQTNLIKELAIKAPKAAVSVVLNQGASGLKAEMLKLYGQETTQGILEAYNAALQQCFLICLVISCLSIVPALGMEWKNVKAEKETKKEQA